MYCTHYLHTCRSTTQVEFTIFYHRSPSRYYLSILSLSCYTLISQSRYDTTDFNRNNTYFPPLPTLPISSTPSATGGGSRGANINNSSYQPAKMGDKGRGGSKGGRNANNGNLDSRRGDRSNNTNTNTNDSYNQQHQFPGMTIPSRGNSNNNTSRNGRSTSISTNSRPHYAAYNATTGRGVSDS